MEQTLSRASCALPSASWPSRPREPEVLRQLARHWGGRGRHGAL